ncbi:phage tail protein [Bartonella sp. HY761]|uniref:phage tail protein n=1 Tax=Bartonella sp. HY761 TaxID=2979330 RepID=UPI0021FE0C4F|nr:phage tail protein [Bartonella sp. HY761]UXN05269.1 phage tail protein [Bartonella sp. HY761]
MPIPMCLGPYMFHSTRFGYNRLGRSLSTTWAELSVVGGLNVAQWMGGQTDKIRLEGVLFPEEFGGLIVMEALRMAAKGGLIFPLIAMTGQYFGNYRIEGVEEDQSYHTRYGLARKNVYSIALTLHIGPPSAGVSIVETLFG